MRVSAEHLRAVCLAVLSSLGVDAAEATTVADNLVMAERRGIATHGVNFLIPLADRIARGLVVVPTNVTTVSDADAVAHLDGGNGLGQTAATLAMRSAIDKARRYGIGLVLIRNTNHIGLLAWYTLMAVNEGLVGFCACNGAASMAPTGGAEPFFGTNPFSVAVPGEDGSPVVLDMSTSIVARGKIRRAERLKERIPPGWALDATGSPTDDPSAAMKGTLLPIGGPKGYGMALFIDLLSGMLSGSKYGREVKTFHKPEGPTGVGVTAPGDRHRPVHAPRRVPRARRGARPGHPRLEESARRLPHLPARRDRGRAGARERRARASRWTLRSANRSTRCWRRPGCRCA